MDIVLKEYRYIPFLAYLYELILPILKKEKSFLILLDILLDGIDGRVICSELKESSLYKNICIILFSASSEKLQDYNNCNADGILEKPFDIQNLLYVLESCLKSRKLEKF